MTSAFVVAQTWPADKTTVVKGHAKQVWTFAEPVLFSLIGAAVQVRFLALVVGCPLDTS